MNDDVPGANGNGVAGWVIAAVIVVAIVVFALLARGPEDQERSGAPPALPAVLVEA